VEQTNCDAVMIGRAAPSNPWIFRQIAQYTAHGRYDQPTEADRYALIRTYFQMLIEEADSATGEHREAQGKMKQFASWFTHGVPGGAHLRKAIYEAKGSVAVLDAVERFFGERLASESAQSPVFMEAVAPAEAIGFQSSSL
jgi:tRNA-dihydrouridine synthase B